MPVRLALAKHEVPDTLRAIAEPMRWRIINALTQEMLCVCHLVADLGASQPLVSHHIRVLKDAGLIVGTREGPWTYYSLAPGALDRVGHEIAQLEEVSGVSKRARRACC
ncbi:MAG: hypothetical protein RLY23_292 [Actinomycetota bacterium]|jgi:DNA-binding transcriptional ArsR family regulator